MKHFKRFYKICLVLLIIFLISLASLYVCAYFAPTLDIKNSGHFYIYDSKENLVYQGSSSSRWVDLEDVSPYIIDAVISVEDKNFYKHNGFDYLRIIKVFFSNLANREIVAGASTISQQYIKNLYLDFDKKWSRKIEEAWLTLKLEVHYDKDQILEGYLNTINYGQGNYGIENAANYYFNKSAKDVTLEEALILAGIPKSPYYFNPVTSYESAKNRALIVAQAMVKNKKLTEEEYNNLFKEEVNIYGKKSENNLQTLMYYQDAVYDELHTLESVPDSLIETGGLKIYTALDMYTQKAMEESMLREMNETGDLQVASVAIDPKTGNVLGLIGGVDYAKSQYNRAIDAERQVGSTMKPLLYYAALENGMTSSSTFLSEPTNFVFANNQTYSPENYNGKYGNQNITMAAAISYSDNIYAVKTHLFLGENVLVDTAKKMGIRKSLDPIVSLPLGTVELSMLDYANAYTTLASGGYKREISFITRVEDLDGHVLYEKKKKDNLVLEPSYVYILNEMLTSTYNSAFIDYNTPTVLSIAGKISRKYAVKTGTTGTDCYMVGYNPDIMMMVWNGYDDNRAVENKLGNISKNMWVDTVEAYEKDKEVTWYQKPENVVGMALNAITGKLDNDLEHSNIFYFIDGSEGIYEVKSAEYEE